MTPGALRRRRLSDTRRAAREGSAARLEVLPAARVREVADPHLRDAAAVSARGIVGAVEKMYRLIRVALRQFLRDVAKLGQRPGNERMVQEAEKHGDGGDQRSTGDGDHPHNRKRGVLQLDRSRTVAGDGAGEGSDGVHN